MPALPAIWAIAPSHTYLLRHEVLWPNMPLDYVKLENDAEGYHYGAFQDDQLVSVISLFIEGEEARFRKFATDPAYQRQGIGSALLRYVLAEARRLGARRLWCDARQDSAAFYARFGMQPEGEVFYKGLIAYVRMARTL
ncbi:GNAT family N-acetyltransferase [Microvirga sp. STR05]|uniref:GNAT family N-acetyltransferase n=1 Tax=Hymenobacter duratus TaxID=2771356 RepID=A0ABR8JJ60_9BACT|nr:GNAT family N-acetyltransferase [Hymenobacter duratus]MBD2714549.1 GNAT family N-acetyltransferase [Hymenobacter duratus]MBR7949453.1 GNAT family N-acetyltransferase [Microvirga sp. STR05]